MLKDRCLTRGACRLDEILAANQLPLAYEPNASLAMSLGEANLLLKRVLGSRSYIEWGSGGSTELVAHLILSKQLPLG